MSRISAIIPTCNRADLLPICIDSLLRQTRHIDEIIVVNDGSTDNTLDVLAHYGDRIQVITQPNGGKSAAMNTGLARATSDYIWFCDDDDIAADDGIEPLAQALDADPSLTFAYGMHQKFPGDRLDDRRLPDFWGQPVPDRALIDFLGNLYPFQFGMLVRRDIFEHIGPFDISFRRAQDVEALIRLALVGKSIYIPHIVFYQRGHSGFRGNPNEQMSQDEALARAVRHDQRALLLHQDRLTLDQVTPGFAAALPTDLRRRAGYLQRACIFARRALWPQAVADLTSAAKEAPAPALPQEIAIAQVSVVKAQMYDLLMQDPESIQTLRQLHKSSPYCRCMISALMRPMPWHIKSALAQGRRDAAWKRFRLMIEILGFGSGAALLLDRVIR